MIWLGWNSEILAGNSADKQRQLNYFNISFLPTQIILNQKRTF